MRKLQSQGVHHITLTGADRQTSINFWEGVLGMPFIFEQPNLDRADESHLYFDPGDGRLITVFTNESRRPEARRTPTDPGCVHHIAFSVSRATFQQAVARLGERDIKHSGVKDRGFMDSIYFEDPLGCSSSSPATGSIRLQDSATPTCCSRPTTSAWPGATTTSPKSTWRTPYRA